MQETYERLRRLSFSTKEVLSKLEGCQTFILGGPSFIGKTTLAALVDQQKVEASLHDAHRGEVFYKISEPEEKLAFLHLPGLFQHVSSHIQEICGAFFVKKVKLCVWYEASFAKKYEGEINVEVVEGTVKSSSSTYRHIVAGYENDFIALDPPLVSDERKASRKRNTKVLEHLQLDAAFSEIAHAIEHHVTTGQDIPECQQTIRKQYGQTKNRSGEVGLTVKGYGASLKNSRTDSNDFFCEIELTGYSSKEVAAMRTFFHKHQLVSNPYLVETYDVINRMEALFEKRKVDAETKSWPSRPEPFTTPFEFVLMGPRVGGKGSVAWAIGDILVYGWRQPSGASVRAPFCATGETQDTVPRALAIKSGDLNFVFIDSNGLQLPKSFHAEPHQIVILVLPANELYDANWELKDPNIFKALAKIV